MIVQNISTETRATDISFTVPRTDEKKAFEMTKKVSDDLGAKGVTMNSNIAKVSIVGVGMRSHVGVATKMFEAMAKAGINIMMISTSEIKISSIIDANETEKAVRTLHDTFELEKT
jgi:aspartate kinase